MSSKKAKKRTNAAESSPAARWARWRQEKEQDREIVIPRGPNLDESTKGEIPFVAAPIEEETQATLFDSTVAPADSAVSSSTNGSVLSDVLDADAHVASDAASAVEVPPHNRAQDDHSSRGESAANFRTASLIIACSI